METGIELIFNMGLEIRNNYWIFIHNNYYHALSIINHVNEVQTVTIIKDC